MALATSDHDLAVAAEVPGARGGPSVHQPTDITVVDPSGGSGKVRLG